MSGHPEYAQGVNLRQLSRALMVAGIAHEDGLEALACSISENVNSLSQAILSGEVRRENRRLRYLLAGLAGIPGTYWDDGEASGQEHGVSVDFVRDSVDTLHEKLTTITMRRLEALTKKGTPT